MADIVPPFTEETARRKVKAAQAAWNSRDPHLCVKSYTADSIWRNRATFLRGHADIVAFLTAKWRRERDYRLRKELFAFGADHIAVQFWYEYRDAGAEAEEGGAEGKEVWRRAYGLEHWTFDAAGKMRKRNMSANEVVVEVDGVEREGTGGRRFRGGEGEGVADQGVDVNAVVDRVVIGEEHR